MAENASKTERERQLDEKIKAMRAKNAMALERKKTVDKDKEMAEISRSSVTSVNKTKYELSDANISTGKLNFKQRSKFDGNTDNKKDQVKKITGRLTDSDGPPPDPGYRFLADRMRDENEEENSKNREENVLNRGGRITKVYRSRDNDYDATSRQSEKTRDRKGIEKEAEDEIIIILEKDRHGRVQNPITLNPDVPRSSLRSTEKKATMASVSNKRIKPKIRSLLDEDECYDFISKNYLKEEQSKGLASPRKIEDQGGKLTITRTVENLKLQELQQESFLGKKFTNVSLTKVETNNFLEPYSFPKDVVASDVNWQCSDPACRLMNLPGSSECGKCKLAYIKSQEYKSNHACEKYKHEFNIKKPKGTQYSNGMTTQVPQTFQQPQNGIQDWSKTQHLEMVPFGGDWVQSPVGINQWQLPQDVMIPQQYGMLVNSVQVSNLQPPPQFYSARQMTPTQPYYPSPVEYVTNPYQSNPHYSYQASTAANFNPTAQVFIPTNDSLPPALFQTPPPPINAAIPPPSRKPQPNFIDKNLVIPLKSPPKPLSFKRSQEVRRPHLDRNFRKSEDIVSCNSRLSEKNSSNAITNKFPKNKEFSATFKPPSMIEMQSGSLKKGSLPLPPPKNKGNGLLLFGTSNVVNNLDTVKLSKELKLPVRLIPAMKLNVFEEKVAHVDPSIDWLVLIHGLGMYCPRFFIYF